MTAWTLTSIAPGLRVVRRLGGGSAHEAFLVEHDGPLGRAVAKLPRPHLAEDVHCLLRLHMEGCALQRLAHPGVPRHLGTVLTGPHPYLLLEHVPGPTLRAALRARTRLTAPLVASLGAGLARALAHIADAGWVHLDVKPSNIVLNARPRLIDFELARLQADAARMRHPMGTWSYMSPEQRHAGVADSAEIGAASDVFSLAASLHEALAGHMLTSPAVPNADTLRGPVGALLADALATEPGDRPTAAELADSLAEWGDDQPRGMSAATVVPPSDGLSTRRVPLIAATRS
jgi:eukaryotic-like serine/threonine-protein kinase